MPRQCHGNGDDHCCYFAGVLCPYLEENTVPGRRWACGLLRQYNNWNRVLTSDEYLQVVQPLWETVPNYVPGMTCESWPNGHPNIMAAGIGLCCHGDPDPNPDPDPQA